ncbi:hypothetical protein PseAD21_06960 [Pseudomonas sp. AD21]|uniref:hypothetical protein n=1 Tax=Pseudomonas sp. AD21 TaxID=396378 RepID=UPI000C84169C|nr:hypothetical protein [Pseudomonas sp. AD21]PMQ12684.1 hypothetical protein PseAD21_06960 [Pseudomonas sp. AD21]
MANQNNDSQLLKIDPVKIPGWVSPIEHPQNADGGVPLVLVAGGLIRILVDPWTNQSLEDSAQLLLNESQTIVATQIIGPTQLNQPFSMSFAASLLRDGINLLRLRVARITQPMPETSEPLRVLFHTPRPGGEIAGGGDNPNLLKALPADVITEGIDAARAAQGVAARLSYVYMRAGDVITVDLDGRNIQHTVTEAQAAVGQVVITLTTNDFWQDNARFALRFRVTDLLGNSSGPQAIWSATTYVDVHIRRPVLDLLAPTVLEARDANGTVLNFVRDFYAAQYATVEVKYTGSAPRQSVKVYWIGRNTTYASEVQIVTAVGQTLQFRIPREEVVDTVGSSAKVYYTVRLPDTTEDRPSKPLNITITGQRHHLPEPTLNAAKDNLRTYYPTLDGTYKVRISLTVETIRYDSEEFFITQPSSYTDVVVPSSWIPPNRGKPGLFNYTLRKTGTGEPIIFSWYLRVTL